MTKLKKNTYNYLTTIPQSSFIMSDAFSPIIIVGALVFPLTMVGIMEASTTLKPSMPYTFSLASTTASGSEAGPILQVEVGW